MHVCISWSKSIQACSTADGQRKLGQHCTCMREHLKNTVPRYLDPLTESNQNQDVEWKLKRNNFHNIIAPHFRGQKIS